MGKMSQKYRCASCAGLEICPSGLSALYLLRDSHEPATRAARVFLALDGASRQPLLHIAWRYGRRNAVVVFIITETRC